MKPVEKVLEVVDRYEERHNGLWCICPAHEDRDPSLHVEEAEDGRALLKCRTGCDQADVMTALERRGLRRRDLFADGDLVPLGGLHKSAGNFPNGREGVAASWSIRDASGRVVAIHERYEGSRKALCVETPGRAPK